MSTSTQNQPARFSLTGERGLSIERVFDAPRDLVWQAFTDPALVAQWWGRGNKLVVERLEVRKGGHWRFVEHAGGETHGFEGRFREVKPPEKLEYTFEWDGMPGHSVVESATFEDLGDGRTRMRATSLFFTQEDRDGMVNSGMEKGMNESYAALDRLLARLSR